MYRKTYIEVNESNLESNVKILLNNYPDYKYYFGVVKGNVYGYGYSSVKCLIKSGINYIAVSTLEEALCVRNEDKDIPILCLQPSKYLYLNTGSQIGETRTLILTLGTGESLSLTITGTVPV